LSEQSSSTSLIGFVWSSTNVVSTLTMKSTQRMPDRAVLVCALVLVHLASAALVSAHDHGHHGIAVREPAALQPGHVVGRFQLVNRLKLLAAPYAQAQLAVAMSPAWTLDDEFATQSSRSEAAGWLSIVDSNLLPSPGHETITIPHLHATPHSSDLEREASDGKRQWELRGR
jgi:hypothetical protein